MPARFPKTLMLDTGYWYALCDVNVRVDCFLTFNARDFFDVCRRRGIPMSYGAA